jgi:adenylosuccinate lyase
MIDRYTRPRMAAIWDLTHKYEIWLEVELQACAAFERAGQIPRGTSAKIRKKAKIDVARIAEIE